MAIQTRDAYKAETLSLQEAEATLEQVKLAINQGAKKQKIR